MSIASSINDKRYDFFETPKPYSYDIQTMIFTFGDDSKAKLITLFEDCEPYQKGVLTHSKKAYRVWKAL